VLDRSKIEAGKLERSRGGAVVAATESANLMTSHGPECARCATARSACRRSRHAIRPRGRIRAASFEADPATSCRKRRGSSRATGGAILSPQGSMPTAAASSRSPMPASAWNARQSRCAQEPVRPGPAARTRPMEAPASACHHAAPLGAWRRA